MPMPIMIWLAVLVEAAIGNWVDMAILLLIQFVNAFIAWCAAPQSICTPSFGMVRVACQFLYQCLLCLRSGQIVVRPGCIPNH